MSSTPTCEEILNELAKTFNPDAARGLNVDVQFIFSGAQSGTFSLHLADGKCTVNKGELDYARLTIRVDVNDWLDLQNGKFNWTEAMMQRKFMATGNFPLLAKLPQIFKIG
ncbi:MAG TPA: SCP2 sterol-binding domain-containing protein [Anaerolineales bacterium]|nr:SCP2 sterol-binding domain-containing protein [Anaerolineales bacterium]HNN12470.1 SCP2 sterol-binding domain-containing protein [Anaerolineales bacterium]HNO32538.1 SCP2 sterol-binding domain-containing protein [Anaerolineales bacterium]